MLDVQSIILCLLSNPIVQLENESSGFFAIARRGARPAKLIHELVIQSRVSELLQPGQEKNVTLRIYAT